MPTQTTPTTPVSTPAPALSPQQQTDLAWITARMSEITPLLAGNDPTAKSLAASVMALLLQHWGATFPHAEAGRKAFFTASAAARQKSLADMATKGAALWAALHQHILSLSIPPVEAVEAIWLSNWALSVPCGQCKAFYRAWTRRTPPDVSTREAYFAWSVALHNAVNAELGKPQMTAAEAAVKWAR